MATRTDNIKDGCELQWKLENISHCWRLRKGLGIASPDFTADALENTKWQLAFNSKENENYFGLYLNRMVDCNGPEEVEIYYQIALLGNDGSVLIEKTALKTFWKDKGWGYTKYETREKVFVTEKGTFIPEDTLTVRCTIWEKTAPVRPERLYARTVFKMHKVSFMWKINNFSTLKSGLKKNLKHSLIDFDLGLSKDQGFEKHLVININSCAADFKCFSFRTSIVDSEGKKENCGTHEYFMDDLKKGELSMPLFSARLAENKSKYFPNDVLSLDCEYAILSRTYSYEFFGSGIIFPNSTSEAAENRKDHARKEKSQNVSSLLDDLKSMYINTILCDTELRTSTRTFPAHKNILSARSPVFLRMFSNDMKEKSSGHVDVTDVEDDTMHRLLLFVYTDSLADLQLDSAAKLYAAADKYEILTLKSRSSSFLKENLCPTNVCDVLELSDLHQDDHLKVMCRIIY